MLELTLFVIGFDASTRIEKMAFTFPVDDYNRNAPTPFLERDPQLFWKLRPGVLGHNSQGFAGPEFSEFKPDGVFRIVCLGDSCTHFGPDAWPQQLQSRLQRETAGAVEVINAGVIGYSSWQGRLLLQQRVVNWSPNVITVYFGWNDHWLARGFPDREQSAGLPWQLAVNNVLDHSRTYQLAAWGIARAARRAAPVTRVSLADYEQNLLEMAATARAHGIGVCLLTAPHALDLGIPEYLLTSGEVADAAQLPDLHRQYNDVVRRVAAAADLALIDLERDMDEMDKSTLFVEDHIHLSEAGRVYVARRVAETLRNSGLLPAETEPEQP